LGFSLPSPLNIFYKFDGSQSVWRANSAMPILRISAARLARAATGLTWGLMVETYQRGDAYPAPSRWPLPFWQKSAG
jgi:hypothetical protein